MHKFENLAKRVIVAIVAIPVIILCSLLGGYYFFALITLISTMSLYEFYKLAENKGIKPLKLVGIITGILINCTFVSQRMQSDILGKIFNTDLTLNFLYPQFQLFTIILIEFVLLVLIVELFRKQGSPIINGSVTLAGVIVISLCLSTLIGLRESFSYAFTTQSSFSTYLLKREYFEDVDKLSGWTIASIFITIWICDTAAYFGGIRYGKHKLLKSVSPKKTWEGAGFGFVFAILAMVIMKLVVLSYLSWVNSVIIGALIGFFGQIGDLVESRFKRDAKVKDSSSLIPGHGGVYDRFDSLIYISPIVYLYINLIVLA